MAWSVDFKARMWRVGAAQSLPLPDEPALLAGSLRLTNAVELAGRLRVDATVMATWSDRELVLRLHQRFGDEFITLLRGEWWLALWLPASGCLLLARDASSQLPLYCAQSAGRVHFACSPLALFAATALPRRVNETLLTLMLSRQPGNDPGATLLEGLVQLVPGHALRIGLEGAATWRYWVPEDLPAIRYQDEREYAEQLLQLLRTAVAGAMTASRHPGSMLSAGLDSGCVTALAARELAGRGRVLPAYTHVPLAEARALQLPMRLADEWPLAAATASHVGHIRHQAIDSADCHLLRAQVDMMQRTGLPSFSGNEPWLQALFRTAQEQGVDLLLNGASGNIAVSWAGCRPGLMQLLCAGDWTSLRARLLDGREATLPMLLRATAGALRRDVRARFAPRVSQSPLLRAGLRPPADAVGHIRQDRIDPHFLAGFLAGSTGMGLRGAVHGFRTADPLADQAVLEFCLAIPPAQYASATTDRWLMRRAMTGVLPEAVALGRARGLQPVDLGWRLRQVAPEVSQVLDHMSRSDLASHFLDISTLRQQEVRVMASPLSWQLLFDFHFALSVGLFLLELDGDLPDALRSSALRQTG